MGGGVAQRPFAVRVVKGEYFEAAILGERGAEILDLAVYLAHAGSLIKTHAEAFCNFHCGDAALEFLDRAVLESYLYHDIILS